MRKSLTGGKIGRMHEEGKCFGNIPILYIETAKGFVSFVVSWVASAEVPEDRFGTRSLSCIIGIKRKVKLSLILRGHGLWGCVF
ncbi:MAG: hypothetical protein ABI197_03805 [Granulicella sp.]